MYSFQYNQWIYLTKFQWFPEGWIGFLLVRKTPAKYSHGFCTVRYKTPQTRPHIVTQSGNTSISPKIPRHDFIAIPWDFVRRISHHQRVFPIGRLLWWQSSFPLTWLSALATVGLSRMASSLWNHDIASTAYHTCTRFMYRQWCLVHVGGVQDAARLWRTIGRKCEIALLLNRADH